MLALGTGLAVGDGRTPVLGTEPGSMDGAAVALGAERGAAVDSAVTGEGTDETGATTVPHAVSVAPMMVASNFRRRDDMCSCIRGIFFHTSHMIDVYRLA
jgi:hypothetical protein